MIKIGDKIYRNLEEQVEYLSHYHDVNQGIAQWGIRVVGQVATASELPDPATYEGEYGDAIAVGTEAPFFFYIWTRSTIEGEPDHWFPFGEISIIGPEGPPGPRGEQGETGESSKWYSNPSVYPELPTFKDGDMLLTTSSSVKGNVYRYIAGNETGKKWFLETNIIGPQGIQGIPGPQGPQGNQGPQGPKGERGDVGGFINIFGILDAANQLPAPTTLNNLTAAYLIGTSEPYDLYVQIGETSESAVWQNVGPFNAATLVTSGGLAQNIWNADTKLDKYTNVTTYNQVYVKAANGGEGTINVTKQNIGDAVVQRQSNSNITIPTIPNVNSDAASKFYVDLDRLMHSGTYVGVTQSLSDTSIDYSGRNPHATAKDPTLTGTMATGAKGSNSASLNGNTIALGSRATAINNKTIAKGDESMAGGYQSVTLQGAESSLAFGEYNVTGGNSSVAFGNSTQALGNHSLTYGYNTEATFPCAMAGGNGTKALAENSVALGSVSTANSPHSIAAGINSTTGGAVSFALGEGVYTSSDHQFVIGKYNQSVQGNAFEIGNGSDIEHPETIFAVTKDGRAKASTVPTDNNDLTNKYYVDNKITSIFTLTGTTLTITTV